MHTLILAGIVLMFTTFIVVLGGVSWWSGQSPKAIVAKASERRRATGYSHNNEAGIAG